MMLLALDTSTSTASLAVYDGQRVLSETSWLAGREHSARLLVEIDAALERIGRAPRDLTGLVVARGPGSYTGVRVGLSVALGIAAGLGVPLWAIDSLDVVARAAGPVTLVIRALLEAGRGRLATAAYLDDRCVEPARLVSLDELVKLVATPTLVIGDLSPIVRARLAAETPARLAPPAACLRRAGFLAELGWRRAQSGDPGTLGAVDAAYLGGSG